MSYEATNESNKSMSLIKGGLECKLMLLFCVGIVLTNLYNCISDFRTECNI